GSPFGSHCTTEPTISPVSCGRTSHHRPWTPGESHRRIVHTNPEATVAEGIEPRTFKSAHSCRVCGHWSEGDWNMAPRGPGGDDQRAKAEREMGRGCCDNCWALHTAQEPRSDG